MKKFFTKLYRDESAQGATEYILLLVVVVTIAMLFKKQLKDLLGSKLEQLNGAISSFNVEN